MDYAVDEFGFDVEEAQRRLIADDSQFNRRVYVRSLFSYYEAFGYFVRQFLIEIQRKKIALGKEVNLDRFYLLQEEFPTVGKNGKIEAKDQKTPFANQFAFTLKEFADLVGVSAHIFGDSGWEATQKAHKIRDRLTHPKVKEDSLVSNEDMEVCRKGYGWFAGLIAVQFKEAAKKSVKAFHARP